MTNPPQPGQNPYDPDGSYGSYGSYGSTGAGDQQNGLPQYPGAAGGYEAYGAPDGQAGYAGYGVPAYGGHPEMPMAGRAAGPWRRLGAYIIDSLLVGVFVSIISQLYLTFPALPQTEADMEQFFVQLTEYSTQVALLNAVVFFAYMTIMQTTNFSTVGKRVLGIRVTELDGSRLSYGRSALRNVWLLLSIVPFLSWFSPFLQIAIFVVMFSGAQTQGLNDKWAKTQVLKREATAF